VAFDGTRNIDSASILLLIVRVRDSLTSPRADVRGLQTDQPPQPAAGAVHTVKNDRVMKAVPYLPICQGMLPWQPNNVG